MRFDDGSSYNPITRWGDGRPEHKLLAELFDAAQDRYRELLKSWSDYLPYLAHLRFEASGGSPDAVCWNNGFLPGLDIAALYCFIRQKRPKVYLEVGSGNSTKIAAMAKRDGGLATRIISIDPCPRAEIDSLCDEVIRQPLESAPRGAFLELGANDIVFVDGSHRALQNSDVTVFFLEVLPTLPPDVLIQIHDIPLPYDYPACWHDRLYSEQYMLATLLLFAADKFEIDLPCAHVSRKPELISILDPLWNTEPRIDTHGDSFWFHRK